jgi:hypothetical protein
VIDMNRAFSRPFIWRIAATLLLGCGTAQAMADADPPGRVARMNYSEGAVAYAPATEKEFTDADPNRPLVPGDKLWTDKGVRAEIQVGSSVARMDGRTQLAVLALDDRSAQFSVTQGTLYLRVRTLPEGENFEVDTPHLAYRAAYPGDYRIDVDPQRDVTRVTIHSGTGAVYGENGQALPMGGGQQITFKGRSLEKVNVQDQPPQDNFDRWAAERNRRDDQSVAARYVPRDVVGYQSLDASGEWRQDASDGPVWYPQGVPANWAPYRNGRWEWIAPWGWTWIDDAPWAFVTSHYGRWALIGTRWAWAPGRMGLKPIYAPALVAFEGNGNAPLSVGGKPAIAWFPLAPGEAWQPPYRTTPLYVSSVNANMPPLKEGAYAYQRKAEAVTAVALEDFSRGRPFRAGALHLAAGALGNAQVTAAPPMPQRSSPTAVAHASAPASAPAAQVQQAVRQSPQQAPRRQDEMQRQAQLLAQQRVQEQTQREAEAQRQRTAQSERQRAQREEEQARAAAQARLAERTRLTAEQKRRAAQQHEAWAESARVAEARRATEQARREAVVARRAEQARRDSRARHERDQQARRAQEAKRLAAAAKKDEQARQVARTRQLEQARRAADRDALVLARQRAQREAWQKQQEALAEQFRRDQQAYEEQQKSRPQRQRPDLRKTPPATEPEVWQRGIPVFTPGRTS